MEVSSNCFDFSWVLCSWNGIDHRFLHSFKPLFHRSRLAFVSQLASCSNRNASSKEKKVNKGKGFSHPSSRTSYIERLCSWLLLRWSSWQFQNFFGTRHPSKTSYSLNLLLEICSHVFFKAIRAKPSSNPLFCSRLLFFKGFSAHYNLSRLL